MLVAVLLLAGCDSDSSHHSESSPANSYQVGVLLPLSGDLAIQGASFKAAIELAADQYPSCELTIKDSEGSGMTAQNAVAEFKQQQIEVIIGPAGSEAADWARAVADSNNQTLLSCSSTAAALALPNDSLFRFAVTDQVQARAMSDKMLNDGITHLAVFLQSDIYGSGLFSALKVEVESWGGTVFGVYDMRGANSVESMNYPLDSFKNDVDLLLDTVGESNIGVAVIMYEQGVNLLAAADEYDQIHRLKWYGSDALALNSKLINDLKAASFAIKTDFSCPILSAFSNPEYTTVKDQISQLIDAPASVYAVMYYDALHVVIDALDQAVSTSSSDFRSALRISAANYSGATGPILLDGNDDRIGHDSFDFWKVASGSGAYVWELDSTWQGQ